MESIETNSILAPLQDESDLDRLLPPSVDAGFWKAAFDSLSCHVAVLDGEGNILAVNDMWRRFASANGGDSDCVGRNYLSVCEHALGDDGAEAVSAAAGLRDVFTGKRREFALSYPCHSPVKKRWFMLRATRFAGPGPGRVVVAHENITAPKAAALRATKYANDLKIANHVLVRQKAELERAEALEADGNRALALVAGNELLNNILHELARMVENQHAGAGAGMLLFRDGSSEFVPGRNFPATSPRELEAMAIAASGDRSAGDLVRLGEAVRPHREHETACELQRVSGEGFSFHSVPNGQKEITTCLVVFTGSTNGSVRGEVVEKACSIGALAVDHAVMLERLSFQAQHDSVTELPNRFLFQERLQNSLQRGRRDGHVFCLLMLDLDRFKQVNDIHGHRAGDALLRAVAHRLLNCMRPEDTVARFGGDEFVVLLNGPEGVHTASLICGAFQTPFSVQDLSLTVTCSVGVSMFPRDGLEAAVLIRNADAALYEAKRMGRNNWRAYENAMGTLAKERAEIEHHLRNALRNRELEVVYQPQTDVLECIIGVEALVRWNNPVLGRVSPSKFIPIAEESGLIVAMGEWVLREACRQSFEWQQAGRSFRMSVNVSVVQMRRDDFAQMVAKVLDETGADPGLLELEITESAMMHHLEDAGREMEKVRRLGVRISIDDFGTGYSSLSYVQNLPIDSIKIDQSFVRELDRGSRNSASIIQSIIALAHHLKLSVVAEGVETTGQREVLVNLRCDVLQGYLLHKPQSPQRINDLFGPEAAALPVCQTRKVANLSPADQSQQENQRQDHCD